MANLSEYKELNKELRAEYVRNEKKLRKLKKKIKVIQKNIDKSQDSLDTLNSDLMATIEVHERLGFRFGIKSPPQRVDQAKNHQKSQSLGM